jgi:hypothetical protein
MKAVVFSLLFSLLLVPQVFAVEVAPRISDREIIESLSELKGGQKALNKRLDDMNLRFNDMNQRFDDLQRSTNQQFDDMNQRFNTLQATLWLFITIALTIMGAMAKILWDHQNQLASIKISLETQKDEIAFLKQLIDKLLPSRSI